MSASSAKLTEDEIQERWPLHWMVWTDNQQALRRRLRDAESDGVSKLPLN